MNKIKIGIFTTIGLITMMCSIIIYSSIMLEDEIDDHVERVKTVAKATQLTAYNPAELEGLPPPVKRYFKFTFVENHQPTELTHFNMEGDFRRPNTEGFEFTTAEQTLSINSPDFIFSATTPILPGVWARVYDAFFNSEMMMKAKIFSLITVVDEQETPELNRISLRRWLLETAMFPAALLPGGHVKWEAINSNKARAIVSKGNLKASLIATFREDGSLASFDAENDGDLTTPYHGSGEQVLRDDYRLVSGMMIPHKFTISRVSHGNVFPFWKGNITSIRFFNSKQ